MVGEQLFVRHFDRIERFFLNKVGDASADLIQRTFLACVEGRERPAVSLEDGLASLRMALAVRRSLESGQVQELGAEASP